MLEPDAAVVMVMAGVGVNNMTGRLPRATSVRHLATTVLALRDTCPDLGVIKPLLSSCGRSRDADPPPSPPIRQMQSIEHGDRTMIP